MLRSAGREDDHENFIITKVFNKQIIFQHFHQLFRENLLPNLGGKIPDAAFHPQRVTLNRFNQNGLYSPDGIYLQQRDVNLLHQRIPFRKTLKVN